MNDEKNGDEQGYNGWANYETWLVNLWLQNEPGTEDDCRVISRREINKGGSAYSLGEELKHYVEDLMPDLGASMAADLLSAALGNVDWREIAEHYMEDYREDGK